jgi:glycosyltransferase involved in cell wall biosynthesis
VSRLATIQTALSWQAARPSGLNRVFLELVRRLPAEGVDVHGLVAGDDSVSRTSGGVVTAFSGEHAPMWLRIVRARREAARLVRRHPGALLASHFAPYGLGLLLARRRERLVVHFHGPWSGESRAEGHGPLSVAARRALERFVYRRADACIVLSAAFGALLVTEFGVDPARVHVIPGAADTARFAALPTREEARRALGWPAGARIVLSVRRLVRRMGLDRLVDAAPAIAREVPGARIVIAGEGVEREALLTRIRERGVQEVVSLAGRLTDDELALAYRAADLTIVPSIALEGFGLVVAESLAAGTPALVTPVGGLPEVVRDLSADLILAESDAGSVARGIAEAFDGTRSMPDAARCVAFARERYDWALAARRTAELYRRVAAAGPGRS